MDTSGRVIIPRRSPATLIVREYDRDVAGSNDLVLGLDSVTIKGRRYTVSAGDIERSNSRGVGANRRTATMVGGGALLGTVIGAIAGGGSVK